MEKELFQMVIQLVDGEKYEELTLLLSDELLSLVANAELFAIRGLAWSKLGNHDRAIRDCSKTIELNPLNASAFGVRATAWGEKGEYDKAIEDSKRSIELNPASVDAYHNLGKIYKQSENYPAASAYYKRWFYHKPKSISKLTDVFKNTFDAPFILKDVFLGIESAGGLLSYSERFQQVISDCRSWTSYLDFLQINDVPKNQPAEFYSLQAIVNFYMGNSIAAYNIFDTKFECPGYPYLLSLRDQYYFTLSAIDFLEPHEGILSFALQQAEAEGHVNNTNRYYAGQLYLLQKDLANAMKYFDSCENFLPALYAKIIIYSQQEDFASLHFTATEIERIESGTNSQYHFISGINPWELDKGADFKMVFTAITNLIFYYELLEEIKDVRTLLAKKHSYDHLEFGRILSFTPSFQEALDMAARMQILQELERHFHNLFEMQVGKYTVPALHEMIFNNNEANTEFNAIQDAIEKKPSNKTAEDVLSIRIQRPVIDTGWYEKIVLYHFLKGDYNRETAFHLYVYVLKIKEMGNGMGTLSGDDKNKISVAKDIGLHFISMPVSLIYKILNTSFTALHLKPGIEIVTDHSLDYKIFKEHFHENLGFFEKEIKEILS